MSTDQSLPPYVLLKLDTGIMAKAILVDDATAVGYWAVSSAQNLQAVYDAGTLSDTITAVIDPEGRRYSSWSTMKQISLENSFSFPLNRIFVTPADLRYGVGVLPGTNIYVLTVPVQNPTGPLPTPEQFADTETTYYVVTSGEGNNIFQTTDKVRAINYLVVYGGSLAESLGAWPGVPVLPA